MSTEIVDYLYKSYIDIFSLGLVTGKIKMASKQSFFFLQDAQAQREWITVSLQKGCECLVAGKFLHSCAVEETITI